MENHNDCTLAWSRTASDVAIGSEPAGVALAMMPNLQRGPAMSDPLPPAEIERREAQVLYVYARSVKLFVRRLLWERLDDNFIRQRVHAMVDVRRGPEDEREIRQRLKDTALVALEETLAEPRQGSPEECN
jgi:hypothetical protein